MKNDNEVLGVAMSTSSIKSILFIDDEQKLLQGLKRMLRPMRKEWDMEFVASGKEGLERLNQRCFDVIISDMKMPEIDGATLLEEAKAICPSSIRMVLSGQAEESSVLQAAKVAHQYMAKPCDIDGLKNRIRKACAIRDLLGKPEVKTALSATIQIPSIPQYYDAFMQQIENEQPEMSTLEQLVISDPGLAAKVLQISNSAFFGPARELSNPVDALKSVGFESIRALTKESQFVSRSTISEDLLPMRALTQHCQGVMKILEKIFTIEHFTEEQQWQARSAGLLHEVGRILLASLLPDSYREVSRLMSEEQLTQTKAEHEVFGVTHPEIGAYLLAIWGLPQEIVEAVAFHHTPEQREADQFNVLAALHVANVLEDELRPRGAYDAKLKLNQDYMHQVGRDEDVNDWLRKCELNG